MRREAGKPGAQRFGGRQVADANDDVGLVISREALVAKQRVIVGDRRVAAAGARQGIGEQGIAGGAGELRDRRGRPSVLAPGDDHAAGRAVDVGRAGSRAPAPA